MIYGEDFAARMEVIGQEVFELVVHRCTQPVQKLQMAREGAELLRLPQQHGFGSCTLGALPNLVPDIASEALNAGRNPVAEDQLDRKFDGDGRISRDQLYFERLRRGAAHFLEYTLGIELPVLRY